MAPMHDILITGLKLLFLHQEHFVKHLKSISGEIGKKTSARPGTRLQIKVLSVSGQLP